MGHIMTGEAAHLIPHLFRRGLSPRTDALPSQCVSAKPTEGFTNNNGGPLCVKPSIFCVDLIY